VNTVVFIVVKNNYAPLLKRRKICLMNTRIPLQLAWELLSEKCANIIFSLKEILLSPDFISRNRRSDKDFTRQRKLPFHLLFSFLINFVKGSYQDELDKFFQAINGYPVAKRVVTKGALAKARLKLKFEAFEELNRHLTKLFEKVFTPKTWYGFRLVAGDSTTIRLPRINEIAEHFGVWNVRQGRACPMARSSQLFDVLNKFSINAVIDPKSVNERDQAAALFRALPQNALVLLDRGYPAFWLFKLILNLNAAFCARVPKSMLIVKELIKSQCKEIIISWAPPVTSLRDCEQVGVDTNPLTLRIIRIDRDKEAPVFVATSLVDTVVYPYELFHELYHYRWPIEEDYKTLKCWLEIENFTGESVQSIYQDFHAKIFSKNLTAILSFPTRLEIEEVGVRRKYVHQINFAQALSKTKYVVVLLLQKPLREIISLIKDLHRIFFRTTIAVRPGRKYPRNVRTSERRFFLSYKPIC